MSTGAIPLVARAVAHGTRRALIASDSEWTYSDLLERSATVAAALLDGGADLAEARVAYLVAPSCAHVATQWGSGAGGVAVPLCVSHPSPELAYVLDDAQVSVVVADAALAPRVRPLAAERGLRFHVADEILRAAPRRWTDTLIVDAERRALILYTSGTTSKPKGVVTTHAILAAQIASVAAAWEWTPTDHLLHVLPLHHLHGILNLLCCPLWSGATCEMQPGFDADIVWDRIIRGDGLTLFMAVPTIYARLLAAWQAASAERRGAIRAGCARLRLMVSGSAALSPTLFEDWRALSGHTLLERYGMTEIGMGLGNPLHGPRLPGTVGVPFPGVSVRLVDDSGRAAAEAAAGEIQISGASLFKEYWRRPRKRAVPSPRTDGFAPATSLPRRRRLPHPRPGVGRYHQERRLQDPALEIEEVLGTHPAIADCAVVGSRMPSGANGSLPQ